MKEHLLAVAELTDGDRAALQGLIPLAGAIGAGTIFSLFAGVRRGGTALRVFEVFAIVAVLSAAASTAAIAIDLLHANTSITGGELTRTATPLIVAVLLLVVVSVYNRISESFDRFLVLLPLICLAVLAAVGLVVSSWSFGPDWAPWVVGAIFAVGLAISGISRLFDRRIRHSDRRTEQRRVVRLAGAGYVPARIDLAPALPQTTARELPLTGWRKGDATLLGHADAARLRDLVKRSWGALYDGEASAAIGPTILLDVDLESLVRRGRGPGRLRVILLTPGAKDPEATREFVGNDDQLFDISELVR